MSIFDKILTWDNYHNEGSHAGTPELLKAIRENNMRSVAKRKGLDLPARLSTSDVIVHPRVNHNRWIVDCPDKECGGAEFAREDGLFLCQSCYNMAHNSQYLKVEWPKNRTAIENVLLKRPYPKNRNWDWSDSLEYLQEQNKEKGVE